MKVFLSFANFYWRFIQGFSKIVAPLTSMLKMTGSPDESAPSRIDSSKSASSRNNNSRPASEKNDSNGEVDGIGISGNSVKHAKKSKKTSKSRKLSKSEKLSKSGKSKSKKMSKSRNSVKSRKKLSKSGNSTNFDATEDGPKFLTPNARTTFNYFRFAFTKAPFL